MGKSKLFLRQKDELCDQQQDMQVFVGHEGKTLSVRGRPALAILTGCG